MRTRVFLSCVLWLVLCSSPLALSPSSIGQAQEKKTELRSISVWATTPDDQPITVTVYRDGKAIATRDVTSRVETSFAKLPRGNYEVHFEAPQYTTVIKKVALEDFDSELKTIMAKGQGTVVFGGGPSLRELEARIKKLEEALAKPQSK
jgi:hypothetical protein